jgi:hypothetical protein
LISPASIVPLEQHAMLVTIQRTAPLTAPTSMVAPSMETGATAIPMLLAAMVVGTTLGPAHVLRARPARPLTCGTMQVSMDATL